MDRLGLRGCSRGGEWGGGFCEWTSENIRRALKYHSFFPVLAAKPPCPSIFLFTTDLARGRAFSWHG